MSHETIEQDQETVGLRVRVDEYLAKAQDRLAYLEGFDQESKKAEIDRLGSEASQLMIDSYQDIETGKIILKEIIKNLGYCQSAIERGNKNVTPAKKVEDLLNQQIERWNKEFEVK